MPRSRIINHDDQLHVRLGGRQGLGPKIQKPSLGHTTMARQGGVNATVKAIVKVSYFPRARLRRHVNYIQHEGTAGPATPAQAMSAQRYATYIGRDGSGEDQRRAPLFSRAGTGVDPEAFLARSRGDPRSWALIVSPGFNGLDITHYVRQFMQQMEMDLGKKLDWIAAGHFDTEHDHAHILLRGKDRHGKEFRLRKDYISESLRAQATSIAWVSRHLGYLREPSVVQNPVRGLSGQIASLQRSLEAWARTHVLEGPGR